MKQSLPDLILSQQKIAGEKRTFLQMHSDGKTRKPAHELDEKRRLLADIEQTITVLEWLRENRATAVEEALAARKAA